MFRNYPDNLIVEDVKQVRPPTGEYKCAVWTGEKYDTFFFKSGAVDTDSLYDDAWDKIKELYGDVERIVCVLPA